MCCAARAILTPLPQPSRLCSAVERYDGGAVRHGIEQTLEPRQETQDTSCGRSALTYTCFANWVARTDIKYSPQFPVMPLFSISLVRVSPVDINFKLLDRAISDPDQVSDHRTG